MTELSVGSATYHFSESVILDARTDRLTCQQGGDLRPASFVVDSAEHHAAAVGIPSLRRAPGIGGVSGDAWTLAVLPTDLLFPVVKLEPSRNHPTLGSDAP